MKDEKYYIVCHTSPYGIQEPNYFTTLSEAQQYIIDSLILLLKEYEIIDEKDQRDTYSIIQWAETNVAIPLFSFDGLSGAIQPYEDEDNCFTDSFKIFVFHPSRI